jgi:dihydrolipoamide dehydrogenase
VPKKLVVVGGGAIGLELGSVWSRLGSEVTVVEFLPKIVATYDDDIIRSFTRILQKQGLKIETSSKVTAVKLQNPAERSDTHSGSTPRERQAPAGHNSKLQTPAILVVNESRSTTTCAPRRKASGPSATSWPGRCWRTRPRRTAWPSPNGSRASLATSIGISCPPSSTPAPRSHFAANGRAIAAGTVDGYAKIIADAQTDRILGAQILGHNAGELISEVVTHMEYGGSAEDLARTIHAHPTMSEAVKEAGLAVSKSAIHAL